MVVFLRHEILLLNKLKKKMENFNSSHFAIQMMLSIQIFFICTLMV